MVLEFKKVNRTEAMKKPEIIKEISEITHYTQREVSDILDAFVAIHQRELIVTGAWNYRGLPYVERHVKKGFKTIDPNTGDITEHPPTCYLRAGLPTTIRKIHNTAFQEYNKDKDFSLEDYADKTL